MPMWQWQEIPPVSRSEEENVKMPTISLKSNGGKVFLAGVSQRVLIQLERYLT